MPGADASDLSLLLDTVKRAGALALAQHGRKPRHWQKPDGTTVTEADIAVDDLLRQSIATARPEDGWLSEETPDAPERLSKRRLWIADPIDGTRLFLAGEQGWGVGMALVVDGAPALSAIFCPSQDKLFHAVAGAGAFMNGSRLDVNGNHSDHVIAPKAQAAALSGHGLAWISGSSLPLLLRFCAIAEGALAGATTLGNKNDWDVAAGHLILKEAGGLTTTEYGGAIVYNRREAWQPGVVAAVPRHHAALLACVRQN